ncbi:MAG: M23 family metallopeptidase, partial [Candidatus Aminicenantes bacterium]
PSDVKVELLYRAFEPGEVVVVEINEPFRVKEAKVRFLDRNYQMGISRMNHTLFAFINIDLGIEPGFYTLTVFIQRLKGGWESVQRRIIIPAKEFPLIKLWVDKKFITPPPEFHERIAWEAEILRVIYGMYTPQWLGEGRFIFPSTGVAKRNFGQRRLYNNYHRSSHRGVDVASPYGSSVIASNSGRVVLARDLYYAGKAVIIDHGLGVFTFYCHFSRILVKRGDFIRRGDVIGNVGATGRVTGPHLHWATVVGRKNVDPFSLLSLNFDS